MVRIRVGFEASADYQDWPTAKSFCSVHDQPESRSFRSCVGTVERLRLYFVPQISLGTSATWSPSRVQVRRIDGKKWPEHFFEVELRNIPRLRNDWLLNPTVIEEYLSQVGPLPFAPQFRFADDITAMLGEHVGLTNITLKVGDKIDPTFRPHRDSFDISGGTDNFEELQKITIPGLRRLELLRSVGCCITATKGQSRTQT